MNEDQAKNVLTPVEDNEIQAWVDGLDSASKQELRRQAIQQAAVNKAATQERKVDWANLSDAAFAEEKRKLGIG